MNFKEYIAKAIFKAVVLTALFMSAMLYAQTNSPVAEDRPHVTNSTEALVTAHDCWTGEAPKDVIPGHVVVTVNGVPRYAGERMVGKALEQIFNDVDNNIQEIHAFCR